MHRGTVEHVPALDMRALRRLGFLRAGECVIDTLFWSNGNLGVAEARVRIDLSDIHQATLAITAQTRGGTIKQRIAIEAAPCRYGGHRFYFLCPHRGYRCEVLYLVGQRFASRKAHGLTYASQGMDQLARIRRRQRKLANRLDGAGLTPRPRGMKRYALANRLHTLKGEEHVLRAETLRRMFAPRRAR